MGREFRVTLFLIALSKKVGHYALIKIQSKTTDTISRFWGVNHTVYMVYFAELRCDV